MARLDDSRRLMGPNLYSGSSGAIAEVMIDAGEDTDAFVAAWRHELDRLLDALRWQDREVVARSYRGGAALFLGAPFDLLLPATEINEWAVSSAIQILNGRSGLPLAPVRDELAVVLAIAERPTLRALTERARARSLPVIVDDEAVTIGAGVHGKTWREVLPSVDAVPWDTLRAIPTALVTGTNGKTTSVRLTARIARIAGRHPGTTSSDGVAVDEKFVEKGDWSGPDGARRVLRHPGVDLAILETARGGILRRGLAITDADAALITNVSADHLGGYGIDDVATMAQVKAVVARVARTVVLNADDPTLCGLARELRGRIVWFATTASELLRGHVAAGGEAWFARDGKVVHAVGGSEFEAIELADVPLTFGGRAAYNVENAVAAAALATALGLPDDAVIEGLRTFTSSPADNPGRGNVLDVGGVTVILDFGHNPAAVRGVIALARSLAGAGALRVTIGMPGDRPDDELIEVAAAISAGQPAQVVVRELPAHLRGRAHGEVPARLAAALGGTVAVVADEITAVRRLLHGAAPGDVILVLVHLDPAVVDLLREP